MVHGSPVQETVASLRTLDDARNKGFTLIEALVVVAIIGILAAMATWYLDSFNRRNGISVAPKLLITEMNMARARALSSGRDVALVVIGPKTQTNVTRCGTIGLAFNNDPNCVQYWVIEGIPPAPNFQVSGGTFDPTAPLAQGGTLVDTGFLAPGIYLGQGSTYTPPANPANATNVFQAIPAANSANAYCSFCSAQGGSLYGGFIRYTPRGDAKLSNGDPGGILFFTTTGEKAAIQDTRLVAFLAPSGIATDRMTQLEK